MTPLPPAQLAALRAVLDRIIPADDFPGALAAGTDAYVVRVLAHERAADAPAIFRGLLDLDLLAATRHGDTRFSALSPLQQDALLTELDAAGEPFFARLVEFALEGFYADPANGGNRDAVSWRMLGYDPRTTVPPSSPTSPA